MEGIVVSMEIRNMEIITYKDEKHREDVVNLWKAAFGYEVSYNAPELVIDQKIEHDDLLYVALDEEQLIGSIMVGYDGHRGWIYSLAVSPNCRKQGVGSQLLTFAQEKLASLGCLKVNLQITGENSEVQAFYEANGFSVEERVSMGKRLG